MNKPTYEELEKRVKELERVEAERKWAEEKEKQFTSDMVLLSNTALGFVDLTPKDNIYHYIGKQLKKFAGNSIVVINSFDKESDSLHVREVLGFGEYTEKALKIMGGHPKGRCVKISEEARVGLTSGELVKVPGGLHVLTFGDFPMSMCSALEKLLSLGDIYAMGITRKGELFGNVAILTRKGTELRNKNVVETFVRQASVALQRRQAEEALQKAHDNLEMRVKERTTELTRSNESLKVEIIERKKAEEALRESEEKFRTFMETASDLMHIADKDGNFTYVNEAMAGTLGYSKEDMIGMHITKVLSKKTLEKDFKLELEKLLTKGEISIEPKWVTKDGRELYVDGDVVSVYDSDGKFAGSRGIFRDITGRKKAEEEKKKLEEQLLHAQKMESIGRLAGGIAHDFNNILAVIMGYADMLRLKFTDSTKSEGKAADAILKSTIRAKDLINQLLGFARKGKYNPEPLSINTLIKDTVNVSEKIFEMKIKVKYDFEENIYLCNADKSQLDQVLTNMIINAKDAMPFGGEITFKTENVCVDEDFIRIVPDLKPGNYVKTSVSDIGIGMPEKIKDYIFDPFFTTKGVGEGTGLGLATVYGIIKNHQGHIDVYSEPGKGTTFTFYLPASDKEVTDEKEEAAIIKGDETILVVDDEEDIREMLKTQLQSLGYIVLTGCDGIDAVSVFKKHKNKIDLVLLDMIMPDMNGKDTYIALKKLNLR